MKGIAVRALPHLFPYRKGNLISIGKRQEGLFRGSLAPQLTRYCNSSRGNRDRSVYSRLLSCGQVPSFNPVSFGVLYKTHISHRHMNAVSRLTGRLWRLSRDREQKQAENGAWTCGSVPGDQQQKQSTCQSRATFPDSDSIISYLSIFLKACPPPDSFTM